MRNLAHLATRLYGVPLMMLPSAADIFGNTFQRILEAPAGTVPAADGEAALLLKPQGFAANVKTDRFADKPYVVTDQGVGVLGIYGALLQRYAFDMASCTSMASYQVIKQQHELMQADPDVKGILIEGDTPGGEVAGNFELARQWLGLRGNKPVWWHANEGTYSAGYSLAAATDRIVVPQAGSVGSIGVVMVHVDQSKRDERMGLAYVFIYAGARKVDFNSHAPLGKKAQELATAEVLRLYDMFTGHVAAARALDVQAVIDTEAGVFPANEAKQLGLIDAVASFDETLAELTDYVASKAASAGFATAGGLAARHNHGGTEMSNPTGAAPTPTAAIPSAPPAGMPEAEVQQREATARAAGATAERTRIGAILNHEAAAQRPKLARKLAFDTDMTADAAASVLGAAGVEQSAEPAKPAAASPLAAAMASAPNPAIGPDAAKGGDDADAATTAKNVVALFNQAKGGK